MTVEFSGGMAIPTYVGIRVAMLGAGVLHVQWQAMPHNAGELQLGEPAPEQWTAAESSSGL